MIRTYAALMTGVAASAALFGGSALAADLVPPPVAAVAPVVIDPPFTGVFSLAGGFSRITESERMYRIMGLDSAIVLTPGRFNIQIGGVGEIGLERSADTYGGIGAETHLGIRNDRFAIGGAGTMIFDQNDDDWNIHYVVAAEAAFYLTRMTVSMQGGYIGVLDTEGFDRLHDALFARGVGQFFVTPNLKIQAEAAYYVGRFDSDFDPFRGFGLGAEVEFKLANAPMSFFGAYDGFWHQDVDWGGDFANRTFTAGMRFYLGQDTLLGNNRNGASFNLPDVIRLNAILAENN